MQVELNRIDNDFHFLATGSTDVPVHIDAALKIGGHDAGARPMELILMGLAGCSAIDIILILKKQRQIVKDFKILVDGTRRDGKLPGVFEKINLHFILSGTIKEDRLARAIKLSMDKYCSVTAMLRPTVEITTSFEVLPN